MENSAGAKYGSYLEGKWFSSEEGFEVVNPATAKPIARVTTIGKADLSRALSFAEAARPSWRGLSAIAFSRSKDQSNGRVRSSRREFQERPKALELEGKADRDRKGGDTSEWPEDLRVRELPR